eukprot:Lithocolla_globosa_v1_NODE_1968_length_2235_cov_8.159174.p1 type:complete len:293 gc:universal NODE_1968_length_2235_cov_8.159174:1194-316(-)
MCLPARSVSATTLRRQVIIHRWWSSTLRRASSGSAPFRTRRPLVSRAACSSSGPTLDGPASLEPMEGQQSSPTTCKRLNIEKRTSTPYHPQGNSVAERHVQSTLMMLRKTLDWNETAWSDQLPATQIALNVQISDLHKSRPFSVMFGRQLNPLDNYSDEEPATVVTPEAAKQQLEQASRVVFPAIPNTPKAAESRLKTFMKKHPHMGSRELFPDGSLVMLANQNRGRKLVVRYEGPYQVINKTKGGSARCYWGHATPQRSTRSLEALFFSPDFNKNNFFEFSFENDSLLFSF